MHKPVNQQKIEALLLQADIQVNGERAWDMQVHEPDLFRRIMGQGSLGLGESYMEGWWDCEAMDEFFCKVLKAKLASQVTTLQDRLFFIYSSLINRQRGRRAFKVGEQHYDVGNDLYRRMLDNKMIYSCGYWQDAHNLDEAQTHKLELVCRKLKLEPGMRVLDIGCGWGGAARYMAENYDVEVVGITISKQQAALATELVSGLNVSIRFQDYRDLTDKYDRIYSIGMFEHVGFKNYRSYFQVVSRCLEERGLFLLHTIGHNQTSAKVDPWVERYIFPNSVLPSSELISRQASDFFAIEDWHNFGLDYYTTLMAWHNNIEAHWHELPGYDETFRRKWRYYLMSAAGTFKAYRNHLWQIVFSKDPQAAPYSAIRSAI